MSRQNAAPAGKAQLLNQPSTWPDKQSAPRRHAVVDEKTQLPYQPPKIGTEARSKANTGTEALQDTNRYGSPVYSFFLLIPSSGTTEVIGGPCPNLS